jgi:hypothetical protein
MKVLSVLITLGGNFSKHLSRVTQLANSNGNM